MLDNHPQWDIPDTEEEDEEQEDSDGIEESDDEDEDNDWRGGRECVGAVPLERPLIH